MYNRHLDTFIDVVEAGSFAAAAEKSYRSRTALIQQINLLEKEVGFKLFKRTNRGVETTEAGRLLYSEAKKIIKSSNAVLEKCRAVERKSKNVIRIGTLPNFKPVVLPELCRIFLKENPDIRIQFTEYPLEKYFTGFTGGKFDITTEYMSGYVFDGPDYNFIKLTQDRHCCGVARSHRLAGRKSLSVADLEGERIILYEKGITYADDALHDYLQKNLKQAELITISQYNSSLPLKCELEGAVLIYYSMYYSSFEPLVTIPLEVDFPIDIGLGYKTDDKESVKKFISLARELFCKSKV